MYTSDFPVRADIVSFEMAHLFANEPSWFRPKSAGVITRIEKKLRAPTLKVMIGCFIIFGTSAAELFPDISASVEADVMARVWELYERIQGDPSIKTKVKIELLEDAIKREEQRKRTRRV